MSILNLRIGGRLYGGFGLLLVICSALAGFGIWQFTVIREQVQTLELHSESIVLAENIQIELHAIRRSILRYMFDQDEASRGETDKRLARVTELLKEAEKAALNEERRAVYRDVARDMADLKAKRLQVDEAIMQMVASRKALLAQGDELAADLRKLVDQAEDSAIQQGTSTLESQILMVQVANWRMLVTHDASLIETSRTNVAKAREQIAIIEKFEFPKFLVAFLTAVKTDLAKYTSTFEDTGPSLLRADELFFKTLFPITQNAIEKMERQKAVIKDAVDGTVTETNGHIDTVIATQKAVATVTVLIGLLIAFLIARGISRPLSALTAAMKRLAAGDFEIVLPGLERKDEVGDMAHAVEDFKVRASEKAKQEAEAKAKQDETTMHQRRSEMHRLADDFETAVGQIVETVSKASQELETSARTLTSSAERAEQKTTMVASASEEASANVQSVATATEELSSSVSEISRQVQESARMANDAVGQAQATTDRVSDLSKAASRIGDVVDLINTIASQTNLLALNATIEAARAGDAGRGFAVVASEVKTLAEQTAKATGEIGQQISGIQVATQDSVNAIKGISGTIEKLAEISATIAAAIEEQGAATQEISRNVQQAARGTQDVSSNIVDVQRGASETGSASSQVLSSAQSLSSDSTRLRHEVGRFLSTVRAS